MLVGNKSQTNLLQQKRASKLRELEKKEQAPSSKPPVTGTATKSTKICKNLEPIVRCNGKQKPPKKARSLLAGGNDISSKPAAAKKTQANSSKAESPKRHNNYKIACFDHQTHYNPRSMIERSTTSRKLALAQPRTSEMVWSSR